jgi:hypothetical protein
MGMFKNVEGDNVVVADNGVYKQCDLYTRNGYMFAKVSGGFVRLMADGSTSKARMRIDTVFTELGLATDGMGRLMQADAHGAKPLLPAKAQLLLDKPDEETP